MTGLRRWAGAAAAVAALALALSACGGGDESAVVVRVGEVGITKGTVDHWAGVLARGGDPPQSVGASHAARSPRRRALVMLISSNWLIGEAARQGKPVPERAVRQALAERIRREGQSRFRERLRRSGETVADVELELRAKLALEEIREELAPGSARATEQEVVRFYRAHRELFRTPEVRLVDIVEELPSADAATALVRRLGTGARFAKVALHKKVAHTSGVLQGQASKKRVDYAIFDARPGVVSRPMMLPNGWSVFIVRGVIPPREKPLGEVRGELLAFLERERRRTYASDFARAFAERWRGRTSCGEGYVVPGCSRYDGPLDEYEARLLAEGES